MASNTDSGLRRGVYWVAIGKKAQLAQENSLSALSSRWDATEWDWKAIRDPKDWESWNASQWSRYSKVCLMGATLWQQILYIDADALARTDLSVGFDILDDGYDMVICPSKAQSSDWCRHVGDEERQEMSYLRSSCALQGGLFWVRRNVCTEEFFDVWREEWLRFEGQDQGALLRALQRTPLRVWLLSQERFVNHRYGAARVGPR